MKKGYIFIAIVLLIILGTIAINQFTKLQKAHSTFENYYAFRGCKQLVSKTDTFATCKLSDGSVIKIVKFNNKWYLNNDLPTCMYNICF